MASTIKTLKAREILDSRGQPTLEVTCITSQGQEAAAGVPAGASTGTREAVELRDGNSRRFAGRGVLKAVAAVETSLREALSGMDVTDQRAVDEALIRLDGTPNKSHLGANAIVGVSMAVARAGAATRGLPLHRCLGGGECLPIPSFNILNGGAHAGWEGAEFQEYMIQPHGAGSFSEALRWATDIYRALKALLKSRGLHTGIGDEGGFAPPVHSNREPLDWLVSAIEQAGLRPGADVALAVDAAANGFHGDAGYQLKIKTEGRTLDSERLIDYYADLVRDYPVALIEDGLHEDDWAGWQRLTGRLDARTTLVGDDIFVTQTAYIQRGIDQRCANAALIKPNQVGTVTETCAAMALAHGSGWSTMVSHRSGETGDDFIADLAVGMGARYLKSGAPVRGERVAKYNRLLAIEAELGVRATFAGRRAP